MKKILITGASRGIGLELCRQLLEQQNTIIATYRSESTAEDLFILNEMFDDLHLFKMNVRKDKSVSDAIEQISVRFDCLDLAFNNAGILDWSKLDEVSENSFREIYETNVIGAFRVSRAILPLLQRSDNALIVNLSSRLGSIGLRGSSQLGGAIAYQCSKAALNMLTKQMSIDYQESGVRVISISPGWVKTDMGGQDAKYEVSESVRLFLSQINQLPDSSNGVFIGEDGNEIPW